MSQLDDDFHAIDSKIDNFLCHQYNWVLNNMCRTSMTGFYVLKEFMQKMKGCSNPHDYLDHYLNLAKDVESDLVLWKNQYDLLNDNDKDEYKIETIQSTNDAFNNNSNENNFLQNNVKNYSLDEFKDSFDEMSSDLSYFRITNHSLSTEEKTESEIDREDKDEDEKTQLIDQRRRKLKKQKTVESVLDSDRDTRIWYKCGWNGCSFGSFYNGVVKRHNEQTHSGETKICVTSESPTHRFKCDWPQCNVSLVAYHKLVEHKRIHTGEKPFKCKWNGCNYATARLYSMISHDKSHRQQTQLN